MLAPVSYTHLDVYKRQAIYERPKTSVNPYLSERGGIHLHKHGFVYLRNRRWHGSLGTMVQSQTTMTTYLYALRVNR